MAIARKRIVSVTFRILATGCVLAPASIAGCRASDDTEDPASSSSNDSDAQAEASPARAADGATGLDANAIDDGSPDALVEGGETPADAESDAGPDPDAGTSVDAGADAGPDPDAGTSVDAGADADAGPSCTVIPGLVGWWRGEDTPNDEVNGFNGSWLGGAANYVPGMSGKAFSLNAAGGGGYVSVPNNPTLTLAIPFTVSVWINVSGNNLRAVDKITNGTGDGYLVDLNDVRQPRFIAGPTLFQAPTITANAWHHVAAVAESTTLRRIYVDGTLAMERTADTPGPQTPNVPLHFGADSDGTNRFSGLVDEVALFDRALTADEVASIFARGAASLCR